MGGKYYNIVQGESGKLISEVLGGGFKEFSYHSNKNTPTLLLGDIVTFYHFGMFALYKHIYYFISLLGNGSHVAHVMLCSLIEQLNNGLSRYEVTDMS